MSKSDPGGFAFPPEAIAFFQELSQTNTKDWFTENKARYVEWVQKPAKAFVAEMRPRLEELSGHQLEAKIFRINRDLRFSKDKTPYKPYQHFLFAPPGRGKSGPAFFYGLQPDKLFVGVGMFAFSAAELSRYRADVVGEAGAELADLLEKQKAAGRRLHDPDLKKVPRGFDADHERAELLLHKGLSVWIDGDEALEATKPDLLDRLERDYQSLLPIYDWLSVRVA